MKNHEIRSTGSKHEVYAWRESAGALHAEVLFSVSGSIASNKLTMTEGTDGRVVASLTHNVAQTKWEWHDAENAVRGSIVFPWLSLKKKFTMESGGQEFVVEGVHDGFVCKSADGASTLLVLRVEKGGDKYSHVVAVDAIPAELALFAVVALRERRE